MKNDPNVDVEHLKHWKKYSPEEKLRWLNDAFLFSKEIERQRKKAGKLVIKFDY